MQGSSCQTAGRRSDSDHHALQWAVLSVVMVAVALAVCTALVFGAIRVVQLLV
jgi:hypothetical protein